MRHQADRLILSCCEQHTWGCAAARHLCFRTPPARQARTQRGGCQRRLPGQAGGIRRGLIPYVGLSWLPGSQQCVRQLRFENSHPCSGGFARAPSGAGALLRSSGRTPVPGTSPCPGGCSARELRCHSVCSVLLVLLLAPSNRHGAVSCYGRSCCSLDTAPGEQSVLDWSCLAAETVVKASAGNPLLQLPGFRWAEGT